jgi:hypothetical protein
MNFFTPALYVRLQDFDPAVMEAADSDWEQAECHYQDRLKQLGRMIEPVLRRFDGVLLHDAVVLGISRQGSQLVMLLRRDIPPREVVTLTYELVGEPFINPDAFPASYRSGVMQFQYDEFDADTINGQVQFSHSLLFSNGWEIRLLFRDVQVSRAQPIYPLPVGASTGVAMTSPSA